MPLDNDRRSSKSRRGRRKRKHISYFVHDQERKQVSIPMIPVIFSEHGNLINYCDFYISNKVKRTYNKNGSILCTDANNVLNHSYAVKDKKNNTVWVNGEHGVTEQFLHDYISMKIAIDDQGTIMNANFRVFIAAIYDIISPDVFDLIVNYINSVYTHTMAEKIAEDAAIGKTSKEYTDTTTLFDTDIKELLCVKFMASMLLPLAVHYANQFNVAGPNSAAPKFLDFHDYFYELYVAGFNRVAHVYGTDVKMKLHKYVSRITTSSFKANIIHQSMGIKGTTKDSLIEDNFAKIITTIILKLECKGTVGAYIYESLRRSNGFSASENNGYNKLTSFSDKDPGGKSSGGGDSVASEAEKLESLVDKPSEQSSLIRRSTYGATLSKIMVILDVYLDNSKLYPYMATHLRNHDFQSQVVHQMFAKYFGSYRDIGDVSSKNYRILVCLASMYLRKNNAPIIADYLTATHTAFTHQQHWGSKHSDKKLYTDPRFVAIGAEKYGDALADFEDKDFIKDSALLLVNNIYKHNDITEGKVGEQIEYKVDEIIDAMLDYYNRFVD